MVTRPVVIAAVVIALAVGGWYAYGWLVPDESARVRTAVETLARTVTDAGRAGHGAGQLAVLADLRSQLTDTVTLEAARRAVLVEGRDQVLGLMARATGQGQLSLAFVDVTVTLARDGASATVGATAELSETSGAGVQSFDALQVEMVWTRPGRSWLLASARAIEVLQ